MKEVEFPQSIQEIKNAILLAENSGFSISISGGKYAMGGQQFGDNTLNLNMSKYNKVVNFDREKGIIEVESGIQWPALIKWLAESQKMTLIRGAFGKNKQGQMT